ncbi:hypothetical protein ABDJ41_14870 [Pedobacter sp. ASV1-7]|uniref:hypothetical protein n=1 Tax=Pedobacter sp. ASV1-7 TaxID=3145237 RepID=UPI0032E90A49
MVRVLNSCEPNAILFVTADNDTFLLWYAQEVEGIRTDIRVVNIQYLSDDAYINQMKPQLNRSAPLPISMPEEKYVNGVRDYLHYFDYGFKDSVELKDLLAVMTSDNKADKLELSNGTYQNFLPSKKWTYNKDYVFKSDLAVLDILANNNWERPVYFETNVSKDTYIGLDNYLYLEGYALRLLPFKTNPKDTRDKTERSHTDVMYNNMMKFDNLYKMTASYGQNELSEKIKIRFKELEENFS